jgi:hypothetical protein
MDDTVVDHYLDARWGFDDRDDETVTCLRSMVFRAFYRHPQDRREV